MIGGADCRGHMCVVSVEEAPYFVFGGADCRGHMCVVSVEEGLIWEQRGRDPFVQMVAKRTSVCVLPLCTAYQGWLVETFWTV